MKIIRFVSDKQMILYGVHQTENPVRAKIIEGNIWETFEVTSRETSITKLLAPLVPVNILALGINYKAHGDEIAMSYPDEPILFLKATTSIAGPEDPIALPAAGSERVDYEGELAIVIGRKAKNISPAEAMEYIMGYTCANDVSARDWQLEKQKGQWARGKSFDSFCPIGPWIVTKDQIADPNNLRIRTTLNGKTVQDSNTANMIFDVRQIVSKLSQSITLLPGTLILTGTPEGVGFTRQPPIYLRDGDLVTIEIENIGMLTNKVIKEQMIT